MPLLTYQDEIEINFGGFIFSDLIDELSNYIHEMEKEEISDYDCMILETLIKTIQKRPEYKNYKKSLKSGNS